MFKVYTSQKTVNRFYIRLKSNFASRKSIMTDIIERCKSQAAKRAVEENINSDCILGVGSGSTMTYVLESLVARCKERNILVKCIPTSYQSKQLIIDYNLPITDLDHHPVIDVTIDGADEVDSNLVAIKGGGACLLQEKVIAFHSKKFFIVADYRKNSKQLGDNWTKGIPIEVLPMSCNSVRHFICHEFNTKMDDIQIRTGKEKAGPIVTDNGNFILDWRFKDCQDWAALADRVRRIVGVIEIGIFAKMVNGAYFGLEDGTVIKRDNTLQ